MQVMVAQQWNILNTTAHLKVVNTVISQHTYFPIIKNSLKKYKVHSLCNIFLKKVSFDQNLKLACYHRKDYVSM